MALLKQKTRMHGGCSTLMPHSISMCCYPVLCNENKTTTNQPRAKKRTTTQHWLATSACVAKNVSGPAANN